MMIQKEYPSLILHLEVGTSDGLSSTVFLPDILTSYMYYIIYMYSTKNVVQRYFYKAIFPIRVPHNMSFPLTTN